MLGTLLATSTWLVFTILQVATVRGWLPNIGDNESYHGVVYELQAPSPCPFLYLLFLQTYHFHCKIIS